MQTDGRETASNRRDQVWDATLEGSDTLRMEGTQAMPADGDFGSRGA